MINKISLSIAFFGAACAFAQQPPNPKQPRHGNMACLNTGFRRRMPLRGDADW